MTTPQTTPQGHDEGTSQSKKPYERPELLNYGELYDSIKFYNFSPCGGNCIAG